MNELLEEFSRECQDEYLMEHYPKQFRYKFLLFLLDKKSKKGTDVVKTNEPEELLKELKYD